VTSDGHDESQQQRGAFILRISRDGKLAAYISGPRSDTRIGVLSLEDRKLINTFSVAKAAQDRLGNDNQSTATSHQPYKGRSGVDRS